VAKLIETLLELNNSQNEFEWSTDLRVRFSSLYLTNDRLFDVISKIGYKAVVGVATVLTELIQLRTAKRYPYIDVTQEFTQKIESLWAGAIDPLYLKRESDFNYKYFDKNNILTPYSSNWFILNFIVDRYVDGSYHIHDFLVNLSMLARHLMPNRKLFDEWFTGTLRKTAETFPCLYDYDDLDKGDKDAKYDCSDDAPVPQEFFFDSEFKYSQDAAKHVLNDFLQKLDYDNNPWLRSPEEMLVKGFRGKPYEI